MVTNDGFLNFARFNPKVFRDFSKFHSDPNASGWSEPINSWNFHDSHGFSSPRIFFRSLFVPPVQRYIPVIGALADHGNSIRITIVMSSLDFFDPTSC